jgi:hypothetical protein
MTAPNAVRTVWRMPHAAALAIMTASHSFAMVNCPVLVPGIQSVVFDIICLLVSISYEAFPPPNDIFPPIDELFLPTNELFLPTDELFLPTNDVFVPTGEPFVPTDELFLPTDKLFPPTGGLFPPPNKAVFQYNEKNEKMG